MEAQYDPISIPQNDLEESLNFVVVDIGISVNKSSPLWQDGRHKKSLPDYHILLNQDQLKLDTQNSQNTIIC